MGTLVGSGVYILLKLNIDDELRIVPEILQLALGAGSPGSEGPGEGEAADHVRAGVSHWGGSVETE